MKILTVCFLLSVFLVCGTSLSSSQPDTRPQRADTCCLEVSDQTKVLLDSLATELENLNRQTIEVLFATEKMSFAKRVMRKRYGKVDVKKVKRIHMLSGKADTVVYVVELSDGVLISPVPLKITDTLTFKKP